MSRMFGTCDECGDWLPLLAISGRVKRHIRNSVVCPGSLHLPRKVT